MQKKAIPLLVFFLLTIHNPLVLAESAVKLIAKIKDALKEEQLERAEKLVEELKKKKDENDLTIYKSEIITQEKNLLAKQLERANILAKTLKYQLKKKVDEFKVMSTTKYAKVQNENNKLRNEIKRVSKQLEKERDGYIKTKKELQRLTGYKKGRAQEQKEIKRTIDKYKKELKKEHDEREKKTKELWDTLRQSEQEHRETKKAFVQDIQDLVKNLDAVNNVIPEQIAYLQKTIELKEKDLKQSKKSFQDYKKFIPEAEEKSKAAKNMFTEFVKNKLTKEELTKFNKLRKTFEKQYQNYQTFATKASNATMETGIHKNAIDLFKNIIKTLNKQQEVIKQTQKLAKKLKAKYSKKTILKKIKGLFS